MKESRRNTIQHSKSSSFAFTIWMTVTVCWSVAMVVSTMLVCCPSSSSTSVVPFHHPNNPVVDDSRKSVAMDMEVGWTTYKTWTTLMTNEYAADQRIIRSTRRRQEVVHPVDAFVVEDLRNWQNGGEEKTSPIMMKAFLMQICHHNLRRAIPREHEHEEQLTSATLAVIFLEEDDATTTSTNVAFFLAASISSLWMHNDIARIVVVGNGRNDTEHRKLLDNALVILQDALTAVVPSSKNGTTETTATRRIHRFLSEIAFVSTNKRRRSFAHVQDAVLSTTTTFDSFAMFESILWMPSNFVLVQFPDMPRTDENDLGVITPHRYPPPLPHHVAILVHTMQQQQQQRCWTLSSTSKDDE